jgi:hypothetical protein
VRDQRDRSGGQVLGLDVADRSQAPGHVDEAHAAAAADRQPGLARRRSDGSPQRTAARCLADHAAEDHRGPVTALRGQRDLLVQRHIRHAEQDQVDRLLDVGQRRDAGPALDHGVVGVDQVHVDPGRAARDLGDHPVAEAAGPGARADQRDRPSLEHRRHGSRPAPSTITHRYRRHASVPHSLVHLYCFD